MDRRVFLGRVGLVGTAVAAPLALTPPAGATTPVPVVQLPPPSGNPTQDTSTIQQAINNSLEGARIVFAPANGGSGYVVNKTIVLIPERYYEGTDQFGTVIMAAPGTNLAAVMAASAWMSPLGTINPGDGSITVANLTIDGNTSANPQGAHGLVLMNERATVTHVTVQNVTQSGIVLSDHTLASSSPTAFHCIENRFTDCTVQGAGQYGIWVIDTDLSGDCTDGYLDSCVVLRTGLQAVRIERSAGWFITNNHVYGCAGDGFYLDQFWGTFFDGNEVDVYGMNAATTAGTYYGIHVANTIQGRPGAVTGCQVSTEEYAGSTFRYYMVHGAGGVATKVVMRANVCHTDSQAGTPVASVGYTYQVSAGASLAVIGQDSCVVDGPAVGVSTGGGGEIALTDTVAAHAAQHGVGGSDQVVLGDPCNLGYAATIYPVPALLGTAAPGAGNAQFAMFVSYGVTTSHLRVVVGDSVGHMSLGAYTPQGAGLQRVPGALQVTTGAIPCPAVGVAKVNLPAPVALGLNWFGALSVDNAQITVGRLPAYGPSMTVGTAAFQASAHPLPATATADNGATLVPWMTSA